MCVCLCRGYGLRSGKEVEQRNEMSADLGMLSHQQRPPSSQTVGSWAVLPAGPIHFALLHHYHATHVSLWSLGRYRLEHHDIQSMAYCGHTSPFFSLGKRHIAHFFTSLCHKCCLPSCSFYPAKIIERICAEK